MNETRAVKWIGQSVERLEDPPLVTGRGRFAGDINFPRQLHMRIVRSNHAHGNIVSIDTEAARALPGVVAVWTAADIPERAADRFPRRPDRKARALSPAGAGDGQGALRRRSGRGGVRGRRLCRRGRRRPRHHGDRGTAAAVVREGRARPNSRPAANTEADILRQGYGDIDAAFRKAHTIVELQLSVGRHSGVPLETRGAIGRYDAVARHAGTARRRQGAASQSGTDRAHAQAQALAGECVRVARRRRLRHPRRALSRRHSGVRRRHAARPAGEMDRGPARTSHRRQPFAQPASQGARGGGGRRRNPRHRRSDFPRPGRLCAHARDPRRHDDVRRAARPLSRAARLSRGLSFPADQQDAGRDLSRAGPLRDQLRARAPGRRHRA